MPRSPLLSVSVALLALLLPAAATAAPAHPGGGSGGGAPDVEESGHIGVRLLEASENRRDDPRARVYIVDHVHPGTTISRRFAVENTSDRPQEITLFSGAAEIDNEKDSFVPAADRNANEISSWVTVNRPRFTAKPHSTNTVRATLSVPAAAPRGERYGAIWAEVASVEPGEEGNVRKIHRVGIRIYLDVGPGGDPPSDFAITELVPGRTDEGLPIVRATVRNTGERALDLNGKLWLADGPGGLNAGPFAVQVGTTVAPGDSANVLVPLDRQLPNGPWKVTLTLESGRIKRTVTGELTFPGEHGWGLPAVLDGPVRLALTIAGALTIAAALLLLALLHRARSRRREAVAP